MQKHQPKLVYDFLFYDNVTVFPIYHYDIRNQNMVKIDIYKSKIEIWQSKADTWIPRWWHK